MSEAAREFLVHVEPVWRQQSDFVINAELPESDLPYRYEQLIVRQVRSNEFEVCCIPFFIRDVNLGDVVRTKPKGGLKHVVDRVIKPSGRYTFRVWFGNSSYPREDVVDRLEGLGATVEWSSRNLLAVDAVDRQHAQLVADYLAEHEGRGHLEYETGRSA